mmetsp:Transcript_5676/g.14156  ORF Transcript_5676/g.14156 Transcript_5676/m.14156 type:complete len:351 (+) Transcript_5676:120-1172(+)|eukprot:CAMPEP_0178994228 /NCGR_PEP_ID=MMETSP0795-20121207/7154_1 /TAXON_ID=88552 /ORGANISM="Amoebophrya sp., Strain Ameob2" /LENGTH=350 /DNA_ID=CAMNT_0020686399 /DNA_START=64 /DNA_END=1116 /DNA_ORIENTATION=-
MASPVLDAQAYADAHLFREEQKTLGAESDVFCAVVDLGAAFHSDVPNAKLIADVGIMIRQRDFHLKGPELLKTTSCEQFINACAVQGKCGQMISTRKGPVLVNIFKSHRMSIMPLSTDQKKLDTVLADLLEQTDSLRVGPNDVATRLQMTNLKEQERDVLEQIADGVLDANGVLVAMPVPTFQTQINQLTVLSRGEYADRVQDWFENMLPSLLTSKVADLKRDLRMEQQAKDAAAAQKAALQQLKSSKGGGGSQRNTPYNNDKNKGGGDKSNKTNKHSKGGGKGLVCEPVKGPLPRMCVEWAWGCCSAGASCTHPHKKVSKEDFKVMQESRVLGSKLKGLKCEDIPEDDW